MSSQPDRLNYSMGMKLTMGNYQSIDFHFSYSSDVKPGESLEKASKRVIKYVEDQIEEKFDEHQDKDK